MKSATVALASGGAINLVAGVINAVFAFGFALIIARQLHAAGVGPFYQAVGVFSILSLLCQLGARVAVVRMIARQRSLGHLGSLRPTIVVAALPGLALACIVGLLLAVLAPEASTVLIHHGDRHAETEYLRFLSLGIPLSTVTTVLVVATH